METLTLQPQTLISLAELIKCWNQDPASQNNSLIITTNQVAITDGKEIIFSLQFPLENEEQIQNNVINNDETEIISESLELEPDGNLTHTDTENTNEELFFSLALIEPEDTSPQDPIPNAVIKLVTDLTENEERVSLRRNPLSETLSENKLREIITRLRIESQGKQREPQVRILEAYYYLEQLKINGNTQKERQRIWDTLKESLGPRRASRIWKCAARIYQILQVCGLSCLYSTTMIIYTNLEELNEENFT